MSYEIADAVSRLISLLRREPASLKHLERLAIKEILYTLILSGAGEFLSRFVMHGTVENSIARAMREIKSRFKEPINMRELATELGISPSSSYHNFKSALGCRRLDISYKTVIVRRFKRLLTSGAEARRDSAGSTQGCSACRIKLTRRHFEAKRRVKLKWSVWTSFGNLKNFMSSVSRNNLANW